MTRSRNHKAARLQAAATGRSAQIVPDSSVKRLLRGKLVKSSSMVSALAVHVSTVPKGDDHDEEHVVVDGVDDPVVTDAYSVARSAR